MLSQLVGGTGIEPGASSTSMRSGVVGVFVREDGKPLDREALSWRVGTVFREAGMPHLQDAYVMRHTFASIMDDKDGEHRIIADMMGHKNVTTFQRIYWLNRIVTETAALMNNIWGSSAA